MSCHRPVRWAVKPVCSEFWCLSSIYNDQNLHVDRISYTSYLLYIGHLNTFTNFSTRHVRIYRVVDRTDLIYDDYQVCPSIYNDGLYLFSSSIPSIYGIMTSDNIKSGRLPCCNISRAILPSSAVVVFPIYNESRSYTNTTRDKEWTHHIVVCSAVIQTTMCRIELRIYGNSVPETTTWTGRFSCLNCHLQSIGWVYPRWEGRPDVPSNSSSDLPANIQRQFRVVCALHQCEVELEWESSASTTNLSGKIPQLPALFRRLQFLYWADSPQQILILHRHQRRAIRSKYLRLYMIAVTSSELVFISSPVGSTTEKVLPLPGSELTVICITLQYNRSATDTNIYCAIIDHSENDVRSTTL